jgi:hypothetical protein
VVERGGLTITLDQADELADALNAHDLSLINALSIKVGKYMLSSVQIRLERGWWEGAGLTLDVAGSDRTRVEGLASQLGDALKPRGRVGLPWLYGTRLLVVLIAAIWTTMVAGVLLTRTLPNTEVGVRLAIVFGPVAVVGGLVVFAAWAGPTIEVLEAGQRSRYVRLRARVLALVAALVIGTAGSILAAVLYTGD